MFGVITWLFHFSQRRQKPLVQHLDYSLVLYSFLLTISLSVVPGLYHILAILLDSQTMMGIQTEFNLSATVMGLANIYGYFLYRRFFADSPWKVIPKVLILNLMFIPMLHFYRFILLWITLGWMKLF